MSRKLIFIILLVFICAGTTALLTNFSTNRADDSENLVQHRKESSEPKPEVPTVVKAEPPKPKPSKPNLQQNYCTNPHTTTCSVRWPSTDPTGKVFSESSGEIRALRLMRNLIRENPEWTSEQVQDELALTIYTEPRRKKIEESFQWVTQAIQKLIQNQPDITISAEEKIALIEQIDRISLDLPPPASVYADSIDLITKNTVYYERTSDNRLRLRMGGAYLLNTTSWFNIIYTFSHEIAHSIDPCEARFAGIVPKTYDNLISCFVKTGWVDSSRAECGPDEQVSEVFADWVASEIISQAIAEKGHSYSSIDLARSAINAGRDLCEQQSVDSLNLSAHQEPDVRIGQIIGQNPSLRKVIGCQSQRKAFNYCKFEPASQPHAMYKEKVQ